MKVTLDSGSVVSGRIMALLRVTQASDVGRSALRTLRRFRAGSAIGRAYQERQSAPPARATISHPRAVGSFPWRTGDARTPAS